MTARAIRADGGSRRKGRRDGKRNPATGLARGFQVSGSGGLPAGVGRGPLSHW
jgi:hypothetical protein